MVEEFNIWLLTWCLLPLALLITLILNLSDKKSRDTKGNISFLLKQLGFSLVLLAISYSLVSFGLPKYLSETFFDFVSIRFLEWIIYPVILVIAGTLLEPKKAK